MSAGPTLSRFTPSLMSAELLERLFVGRDRLLESVVARIEAAATSAGRNHTLLVGPRGAGKTHLVALAHHRAGRLIDGGARLQRSWLPEDPWTIASYRHLLAAVARHAGLTMPRDASTVELEDALNVSATERGPIVVFVENLDQILEQLENAGQQQLRHLLQNSRSLLLVASTTRLDRNLSDQSRPFYGFFTTTRLEPFDVDEAASMLQAIAAETGQDDLVDYLATDEAGARLRTIAHLAGGQPRMWATLAGSLTIRGLDELVELLLTRFDDLTPYYQEQLARLSARQRLVVSELATVDRPMTVRDLAARLDVDQRSLGKTMSELVERGWAQTVTTPLLEGLVDRRLSHYELAEPMARLAFQLKESRGEPLRLVVDFLKNWFDPGQLEQTRASAVEYAYLESAALAQTTDPVLAVTRHLHQLPATRAPAVELLGEVDDALANLQAGRQAAFLGLPTPVRSAVERLAEDKSVPMIRRTLHDLAMLEFGHVRHPAMASWLERAAASAPTSEAARVLYLRWLGRAWRFAEAVAGLGRSGGDDLAVIDARADVAFSAWEAGQPELAAGLEEWVLVDRERVLGPHHSDTLVSRANLAADYNALGRHEEALALAESVLAEREQALGGDHWATLSARANLASTLGHLGHHRRALRIKESVLRDRERLLGPDHPSTLLARANLAVTLGELDRHAEALSLQQAVLDDLARLRDPEDPDTMVSRANLAVTLGRMGKSDEARMLLTSVVADSESVLGADHPATVLRRSYLTSLA